MPFEVFLALRYFRSRKKRKLARATALAAIAGISIGVAALIVALALSNGFRQEMRDKILSGTAHLTIIRNDGQPLQNYQELAARLRTFGGVANAAGTTYDGAVISGPKGSAYAVLRGIDRDSMPARAEVKNWMVHGSFDQLFQAAAERTQETSVRVILGSELAAKIGVYSGDIIEIIPANPNLKDLHKHKARVAGTFRSGLFEYDSAWAYLSLESAAAIIGAPPAASLISVQVHDLNQVKTIAASLTTALGNYYSVVDWQQANQPLFNALALERRVGLVIVGLIILIAMLNITSMLVLVVVERKRDIAILNAMGAGKGSITSLFMIEGAIIGAIGSLAGAGLGLLACGIGNRYQLVSLPADVYSISNVPFQTNFAEIVLAVVIAFVLSVLATVYPASAAARLRPAEVLRDIG